MTGVAVASESSGRHASPAQRKVTLPTGRLLLSATGAALGAGALAELVFRVLDPEPSRSGYGLASGLIVLVAAVAVLLVLRPWVPRALQTWPMLWVAGSFGRMVCTLGLTAVVYSAALPGAELWLGVVACYVLVMLAETRVYVGAMRPYVPEAWSSSGVSSPDSEEDQ